MSAQNPITTPHPDRARPTAIECDYAAGPKPGAGGARDYDRGTVSVDVPNMFVDLADLVARKMRQQGKQADWEGVLIEMIEIGSDALGEHYQVGPEVKR